ncbi:MAG: putative ATP-grasp-modified RiPP [Pseudonocardiaceae bacterium]
MSAVKTTSEPLGGAVALFPLARYVATDAVVPPGLSARPFGVRYAVVPEPARSCPAVDFSAWDYDPVRQIAMVRAEDGLVIEAARHCDGPTQTPTNTSDGTRFERDNDVVED